MFVRLLGYTQYVLVTKTESKHDVFNYKETHLSCVRNLNHWQITDPVWLIFPTISSSFGVSPHSTCFYISNVCVVSCFPFGPMCVATLFYCLGLIGWLCRWAVNQKHNRYIYNKLRISLSSSLFFFLIFIKTVLSPCVQVEWFIHKI